MILFSKIMFSCAMQKSMKKTLDKKIRNACFFFRAPVCFHSNLPTHDKKISSTSVFFAPMRFRVQRFISLNKISFLSHNTGYRHDRANLKVPSESE